MKKNNYYKASLALGLAAAGLLATYPWHTGFLGGLLFSGFAAATIGGCADWFAVTALFRRPLGIRPGRVIRTEIIPRNRERLFSAAVDMVQNELLTVDVINKKLNDLYFSDLIIRYLDEHGGKQDLAEVLASIVEDILAKADLRLVSRLVEDLLKRNAAELELAPFIAQLIEYSREKGYEQRAVDFVLEEALTLVRHPQTGSLIFHLISEALSAYEKGMDRRKFVNSLLLDLSPVALAEKSQAELQLRLEEIKLTPDHPARLKLSALIAQFIEKLQHNKEWQEKVESWKLGQITNLRLTKHISQFIALKRQELTADPAQLQNLLTFIKQRVNDAFEGFKRDQDRQNRLDSMIKAILSGWFEARHGLIGNLVRESLSRFSDARLVALIEEKAGNDLQIIRINGTVVGGIAGMLIYLATFWLT
ncbi:MAG TPA: DUF445 domain-containing protein [Desulfobacteria bacterium]|nr:DUF445 domain-containing protein [Desulfobacteria bacterium]